MTAAMLEAITLAGFFILALNVILCVGRAVVGPSHFDRIMALECLTFNLSGAVVLVSFYLRTGTFMDFILVVALLGFIGTVALTAFVEGKLVD